MHTFLVWLYHNFVMDSYDSFIHNFDNLFTATEGIMSQRQWNYAEIYG